jgi:hypothetical protein
VERSAGEVLYSKDYSVGVDGLRRADKYTTGKWFEPATLYVLSDELSRESLGG